jgi:hypothetical protein
MFSSNQSIPIGAKVEISIKGFTLGVKAEIYLFFKKFCPKLLINAQVYGLVFGNQGWKKDTIQFGKPICNSWGQCSSIY